MKNKLVAILMLSILSVTMIPLMIGQTNASSTKGGTWYLDEGTGNIAHDNSGNGNHGMIYGATWTNGKIGEALEFDGVNDYVEAPDSSSLDITGKLTLEAWIYPYTVSKMQIIVQKYNYSGPPYNGAYYLGVGGYGYNNKILFALSPNGYNFYYMLSKTNITANTWTHVAGTSNGTHLIIYINGVKDKVAAYAPGAIYASAAPLRIGTFLPELGQPRYFYGIIDEVRVAAGTIWTVDDDKVQCPNADFTTIQAAINQAGSDDTIIVHDGTYNEAPYVNKSLTIKAASTPIISGGQMRTTNYGNRQATIFVENAGYVTLQGFDVEGQGLGVPAGTKSYAILYENSHGMIRECIVSPNTIGDMYSAAVAFWDNSTVTIENCLVENFGRIGIYANNATCFIRHNEIIGQIYSLDNQVNYGIEIEDYTGPSAAEIISNEIYNCDNTHPSPLWSSCAIIIDIWKMFYDLLPSTVAIENNDIHDNFEAIEIVSNSLSYAHYNDIYNNRYGVWVDPDLYNNYATFDARFNWWGDASGPNQATTNPTGLGNDAGDYVDYSPWLGDTFATIPRTYHVNPSGAPSAIQEAIDEASAGDTVIVHDGTYDEQIVINKSLTVQGGSTPIIKPSSAAILTTVLDGFFWGGTKQIAGIIVANAAGSNVIVENIIVDGENIITKPTGADYVTGIFYRETGGTINAVTVANMTIDSTGTAVRGYGVYLSAITYTVSVEIEYCTITEYDKNAIDAHGNKLTANIHDNTLTGRGVLPNGDEVQNGVVVMDGATGTVDFNDISNMAYIPETWWSAGIMFLESDGSAEENTITNCQMGIIFQDGSGTARTNTIAGGTVGLLGLWAQYTQAGTWTATFEDNIVSGAHDSPGYENGAIGAQSWDAGSSLVVTIHNNELLGDGLTSADGIYIGDVPEYDPAGSIQAIITDNTISGWQNGIHLVSSVVNADISSNDITNTYLGIRTESVSGIQICSNTITEFQKGGIVTRGTQDIFIEDNTISTTLHDLAPNGIDIGTYSGTSGTIKGNEISGCSWNGFTGDYDTSWSGSGILVIESGDSLEILGNTVHDCDVGMDIESDSMNITGNEVYDNIYGFVFWNANPNVNYNSIHNNVQYGVYRTALGDLTGALDARFNWWGDSTGPYHPTSWEYMGEPYGPHLGLGDRVSDYVLYVPWLPVVHDVAVTDVTVSPTIVVAGETVTINVTVKNEGSDFENFTVTVYYDGTPISSQDIINLFPDFGATLTFYWDTTSVPQGIYTIKAEASEVPEEIDILDNVLVDGTVEVLWHDVAVIDVVSDRTWAYQGNLVSINVTVANEGDFDETVTVTLYYDIAEAKVIGTQIIDLAIGESKTITFVWNTTDVPYCHNYILTAVATIVPQDNDPVDNTFTNGAVKIRIPGDVDGDGTVDMLDISIIVDAFLSFPSHPNWNPDADIISDNSIDMADISRAIDYFLVSC